MSPAILVRDLGKSYREGFWGTKKKVLEGVSFRVPRGEIFGFLGANGAGKTTTLKIALGLQRADQGEVRLMDFPSEDQRSRRKVGFLPERPYFPPNFTADEFLDFHRALYGMRAGPSNEELCRLVGLPGIGPHYLRGFSKGMLQRIGIAQSLVGDPELLILDEPVSGLDPVGRKEMRSLLFELHRREKTVFFSSHILADVETLCREIVFLEKGKLRYSGSVAELLGEGEYEILFAANADLSALNIAGEKLGSSQRVLVKGESEARRLVEQAWLKGAVVERFGRVHRTLEEALFGKEKM